MRGLADKQIQAIEKVTRRRTVALSGAMLEKDLLVRDAVEIVCRAGSQIGAHIIFCGGTALSQAHGVIERMSEDADFRIVVPKAVTGQTAKRRFLSSIKAAIQKSLEDAGFPLDGEMKGRNGNEYIMGQFAYQSAFTASDGALRPHIKIEITAFAPISPIETKPLRTVLDRIGAPQKDPPPAPLVPVVSIADTVADKIVGYLRRTAQDQAGLGRGAYDDRLVRHLYDVYAIRKRAADQCPLERLIPLVTQVIARDQAAYGNQFPAFRAEPTSVLLGILESLTSDAATGKRYMRFCQSLIWGETPSYSEVAGTFVIWAHEVLGIGSRKDGCDESDVQMA
jgi:hypothetical protein